MFIIGNKKDPTIFWSNEFGWTGADEADTFTKVDQSRLNLPLEGYWCPLWSVDTIQFARMIAECEAAGVFATPEFKAAADSMDLDTEQLSSIIERAQTFWDEWVAKVKTAQDNTH